MLFVAATAGVLVGAICHFLGVPLRNNLVASGIVTVVLAAYFLYFFRDPERRPPTDPSMIVAGADGVIAGIVELQPADFERCAKFSGMSDAGRFKGGPVTRISIFLSLFDVHVNRAPIGGNSTFLGYFPRRHIFTFKEKSSDYNQHNSILIENDRTVCLFNQIVGPVARRVIYWLDHNKAVPVKAGDRLGMMKFGSRLDMYFPSGDVTITVKQGDTTRAGETVIATLRQR
jgi:phosphatidylserine decarboxylase